MVEVILDSEQIMLDRWSIHEEKQLYIADEGVDLDIHDPECITKVSDFIMEAIMISKDGPLEYY